MINKIANLAEKKGICAEWLAVMRAKGSWKNLCTMYFAGSDWSMKNDFPNEEMARQIKDDTLKYGLLTDFVGELIFKNGRKENQKAFLGNSKVVISAEDFSANEIIMRHNSEVTVNASKHSYTIINVLDDAKLTVNNRGGVVHIYCYGSEKNIILTGAHVDVKKSSF